MIHRAIHALQLTSFLLGRSIFRVTADSARNPQIKKIGLPMSSILSMSLSYIQKYEERDDAHYFVFVT